MKKIDELDINIIKLMREDGRISISDVAEKCGVSRAVVRSRFIKMFEQSIISRPTILVDPRAFGYTTCAMIQVFNETMEHYHSVIDELKAIPEIVECYLVTGRANTIMKVYARDNEHLARVIAQIQRVTQAPSETLISLEQTIARGLELNANFLKG